MSHVYQLIYDKLFKYYGPQYWWPAESSFEMMIGAILVQNTSWRNVEKALANLKPILTPELIYELSTEELARLIRPSGFFNIKTRRIKAFLEWFKSYHFDVKRIKKGTGQDLREELLQIKGIGRETADVMLLYAFDKPVFVVDAYARRIFHRLGHDMPASYDDFRKWIEMELPDNVTLFNEYHALLVEHAKQHCRSKPLCNSCPLRNICDQRLE